MNIITDENKRVVNYDQIVHLVDSSLDINELTSLLQNLQSLLTAHAIDLDDAKVLMGSVSGKLKLLSSPEILDSLTKIRNQNQMEQQSVKKMTFLPTSVSNRAGVVSNVLLIFNLAIITIMFTILFIAKIIK